MTDKLITCPHCTRKGWAPDNVWPATDEFWLRRNGRLHFGACKACRSDAHQATPSYQRKRLGQIARKHTQAIRKARSAA